MFNSLNKIWNISVSRFYKGSTVQNSLILIIGTVVSQLITVISMPVLSRIYDPEKFGLYAVFLGLSTIISVMVTLRYETAIMLPKNNEQAVSLLALSIELVFVTTLLILVGLFFILTFFPEVEFVKSLNNWLLFTALLGACIAISNILMVWFSRKKQFKVIAAVKIFQAVLIFILSVFFGYLKFKDGLLYGHLIALFIVSSIILYKSFNFNMFSQIKNFVSIAREHINAPKFLLPSALLDVGTQQLPVFLITSWFGTELAGQFSMSWRVLIMPMAFIGVSVGQVFYQRFAESWPNKNESLNFLKKTWKMLFFIGIVPSLILFFFGEPIFSIVLGEKWSFAGKIAENMSPILLAMLVSSPTSSAFLVLGLQKFTLFFGSAFLIYRTLAIYIGYSMGNLIYGLLVWVVFEIVAILFYNYLIYKRIKTHEIN